MFYLYLSQVFSHFLLILSHNQMVYNWVETSSSLEAAGDIGYWVDTKPTAGASMPAELASGEAAKAYVAVANPSEPEAKLVVGAEAARLTVEVADN